MASEGCKHCFGAIQAYRQSLSPAASDFKGLTRIGKHGHEWTGDVIFREKKLNEPRKYKGHSFWLGAMSDPFHEKLTLHQIALMYSVMADTPENTYMILTKRIELMHKLYTDGSLKKEIERILGYSIKWPLVNTWEGTSIENEKWAKQRLPILVDIPSNFRFLSIQPILSNIGNIRPYLKKIKFAILGNEAGPLSICRPVPKDDIAEAQWQLYSTRTPHLTLCYPK
jgi:protein gp37